MGAFYRSLLQNHVLANLVFVLVLVIGLLSYMNLPRQQDPTINFNWIVITTVLPGASALDVEKKVTDPIEDAVRKIQNINFMSSTSRESVSSILVRFQDIDERTFDKSVADLRREIQNKESELPDAAEDPQILEITTANAFPSATVAVVGQSLDEELRIQARNIQKGLERVKGVDRVDPIGLPEPELQVNFDTALLEELNLSPGQVADTVSAFFQDIAAGDTRLGEQNWLVRLVGSSNDPGQLASRTIVGAQGEVTLGTVARVERGRAEPSQLTSFNERPAVLLAVMKQANANTIELVDRIKAYMQGRNIYSDQTGIELILVDDQTVVTKSAISLMQRNALIGLVLVLIVAWFFLGSRIALLTAIGIPFILAGTFWILSGVGETLNVMVLLGVVIVLGMLVDDAVVVVEGIYYRVRHGMKPMEASMEALNEVAAPVTAAVFTTIAAFGPLILLPGILGDFMRVVPIVVVVALSLSLIEAFWMLPAHVTAAKVSFEKPSRIHKYRVKLTHAIQIKYVRLLVKFLRHRWLAFSFVILLFVSAFGAMAAGMVRMDFFAADTIRLFYVNVEMPPETTLHSTLKKVEEIERKVQSHLRDGEARAVLSYSGNMFTETAPRLGEHVGQIMVGLNPKTPDLRTVEAMIEEMRSDIMATPGPVQISFLRLAGGPPTEKPISIKVRGDSYPEIREAADALRDLLSGIEGVKDIDDDASKGRSELILSLDEDAINRTGINPLEVTRTIQLLVDGLVVTDMRDTGEKVDIRVKGSDRNIKNINELLQFRLPLADGGSVPLIELVKEQRETGLGNIRHYNFRRAITVEADLEETLIDTVTANQLIQKGWNDIQNNYPDIDLDFSGELDDIYEAMDSILILFLFGVGVMYAILGTQFRSYWQPFMILSTLFMAFTGVTFGLLISGNPMSLYTLYGIVALAGIAVNAAIVLISAGNMRLKAGMSVLHATIYAARRRVIPILITSLTTVAGLFSLATGLGGKSLIWGPVATAIVWGLVFSTSLTLVIVPLLYRQFMTKSHLLQPPE
ncbi:cation transporter [Solemya velum gill symbiont]|uniref:efflux RND transporter permease subunit n=1 Tax=Solemya velum gill symbiont TaxID=2340 RepID=UPI0009D3E01E|nr:efflux RND transporter permease subunit [Solemya velum gill symbiont]OOZ15185.1 cation transporter [Solemya velum gill symbiont]OOZ19777.1 cation transporter [Solemya velum gill symbiont]OOZ22689.1 cation transporter [Solemya velum gill symbiont]OOZ24672.1 cation transporter [Solemya velum gill symbiont]OOZ29006.1 cation transporter [Solemya velum gill symbiont]